MGELKSYLTASGPKQVNLSAWKRQEKDDRDAKYAIKLQTGLLGALPTQVDNRNICSPIEDQGNLGSCTANAFAALVEANENRRLAAQKALQPAYNINRPQAAPKASYTTVAVSGVNTSVNKVVSFRCTVTPAGTVTAGANSQVAVSSVTTNPKGVSTFNVTVTPGISSPSTGGSALTDCSRLFTYYATRLIEGTTSFDSGASIRNTIKSGYTYGCVSESIYPYNINNYTKNPAQSIWNTAATHKVTLYSSINDGDIATMKAMLSAPIPFLISFGFDVYDYFLSSQMTKNGILGLPKSNESLQGGHAVVLVGYDDNMPMPDGTTGAFLVRNSWGTGWGWQGSGYFWMSYAYVGNISMCNDFWVVKSAPL